MDWILGREGLLVGWWQGLMVMLSLDPNLTKPHISKLQRGDQTGELTDVVFRIIGFRKSLQKLPHSVIFHTERAGYWV